MHKKRLFILLFCFVSSAGTLFAQTGSDSLNLTDSAGILISSINIVGNRHTKTFILLREIHFKAGDRIKKGELAANFIRARNQVYNTNLFTEVTVDSVVQPDMSLAVNFTVREKWYVFPTPQFQLADRSFNEWIKTYNADLRRVVYGVKFVHYNFSGRRDQLRFFLLNGYARNISASYSNPYSNRALTEGYGVSAGFTQNREIGYRTSYKNRLQLYRAEGFVRNSFGMSAAYTRRKGFFKSSSFSTGLTYINIDEKIISPAFNPGYFNDNKKYQLFPDFGFGINYVNTDNNNYPQKGLIYGAGISKRGLGFTGGINNTTLAASFSKFITHKKNWFSNVRASGLLKVPFNQAYINLAGVGLRGLEYYVISGVANTTLKYTLSKKLVAFNLPIPFKIKTIPFIPFRIYAKTYSDLGFTYATDQSKTMLNNRLLYTGGFGLDIVTLYDIVLKLEYSFNQLGEKGLFLHGNGGF
ncbi:MAG: POTRA domain-containing protein [Ferruginibacter sp.]